jgi:hypothetical protein
MGRHPSRIFFPSFSNKKGGSIERRRRWHIMGFRRRNGDFAADLYKAVQKSKKKSKKLVDFVVDAMQHLAIFSFTICSISQSNFFSIQVNF